MWLKYVVSVGQDAWEQWLISLIEHLGQCWRRATAVSKSLAPAQKRRTLGIRNASLPLVERRFGCVYRLFISLIMRRMFKCAITGNDWINAFWRLHSTSWWPVVVQRTQRIWVHITSLSTFDLRRTNSTQVYTTSIQTCQTIKLDTKAMPTSRHCNTGRSTHYPLPEENILPYL